MSATRTLDTRTERPVLMRLLDNLIDAIPAEDGRPGEFVALVHRNEFERGYTTALLHLLRTLGVIKTDRELLSAQVVSPQAGHLLLQLRELLCLDRPLVADWNRVGLSPHDQLRHPFEAGVDLVRALEERRLELRPDSVPLRRTHAAVGLLLRRTPAGEHFLLLEYDHPARQWQLPGGRHERHDLTLRATLRRELSEELGCGALLEPEDVILYDLCHVQAAARRSPTYGLLTATTFRVFAVRFVHGLPSLHSGLRWASQAEVLAGRTAAGDHVATPLAEILVQLGGTLNSVPTITERETA
jgi:8-oxo-dGTP pyrophosphatase MutT (NUDIX family)